MPDKSKFEREIDEILEKTDDSAPPERRERGSGTHKSFEPFSTSVPKRKISKRKSTIKFNPGNLIIIGLVVLAIAAFTPAAKIPIAIIGAILLIAGYALSFQRGSNRAAGSGSSGGIFGRGGKSAEPEKSEPQVKYWRGRKIEEKPERPDRGKIIDFGPPDDDQDPSKK
jgi:hypothetical protein